MTNENKPPVSKKGIMAVAAMHDENKPPVSDADADWAKAQDAYANKPPVRADRLLQAGWSSPTTTGNMLNEMKNKDARIAELEALITELEEEAAHDERLARDQRARIAELEAEVGVLKDGLNYNDEILRKETIERCAQVAENYAAWPTKVAAAIRALKDKPP